MVHQGQCPVCFEIHSIDEAQIGSVVPCACGTELFACEARSFVEIPVRCPQCRESYLAEPDDIGETVECDCGAPFTVLDIVLQRPMLRESQDLPSPQPEPRSNPDSPAVITVEQTAASEPKGGPDAKTTSEPTSTPRRSSTPWIPIAGTLAVAALFVASIAMFLTRHSRNAGTETTATRSAYSHSTSKKGLSGVASLEAATRIETSKLQAMLARVPPPESLLAATDVPDASVSSSANPMTQDEPSRSPFGGRTKPRKTSLPQATEARPRIPFVEVKRRFQIFDHAYQQAFESYEAFSTVEDTESAEYQNKLGETLSLVRHAYEMALQEKDKTRLSELTYLLAYLYHRAGWLIEASIFGEAAARWGELDEPATREALMIALAATQEAAAIQWGNPELVGELGQMWSLAELLDERWPEDEQRDEIWMTLAQNYSLFNETLRAAEAYQKIPKGSELYRDAQLAAGSEYWNRFIDRASIESPDSDELVGLLESAYLHLESAVDLMDPRANGSANDYYSAKLTLAKIADRLGRYDDVVTWMEGKPKPLVDQFLPSASPERKRQPFVSRNAQTVFSLLHDAKEQTGDARGAQQALKQLASLPNSGQSDDLRRMFLSVAKAQLKETQEKQNVTAEDIEKLSESLSNISEPPTNRDASTMFWVGESWAKIAEKCDNDELKKSCYTKAATAYSAALDLEEVPDNLRSSIVLRRAELLRRSGQLQASLDSIASLLEENPNIIELQFEAAKTLQQISFRDATFPSLLDAIRGPSSDSGNGVNSSVWGWERLVAFLHRLRYSPQGTDQHATQLLEAQFHLARCRWILASAMSDSPDRDALIAKTRMQTRQLIATIPLDDFSKTPWRKGLEKILADLDRQAG